MQLPWKDKPRVSHVVSEYAVYPVHAGSSGTAQLIDHRIHYRDLRVAVNSLSQQKMINTPGRGSELVLDEIWQNILNAPPSSFALRDASSSLTYKELTNLVCKVTSLLNEKEVQLGDCVAVILPRTILLPLVLFSLLKNGMKYVYLDPAYPNARLRFILSSCKAQLLLGDQENLFRFDHLSSQSVSFDTLDRLTCKEPPQNTPTAGYVMFTSGTTGEPKGIPINHQRITAYLHALSKRLEIITDDSCLHTAPFATSASIRQFLLPLYSQATLVIASETELADPIKLAELIIQKQVSVIDGVQPYWQRAILLFESHGRHDFFPLSQVRLMCFSGGILTYEFVQDLRQRSRYHGDVINIYGQTETIGVSTFRLQDDLDGKSGIVPIGMPYDNIEFFADEAGELNVSMPGLAHGYLNKDDDAFYSLAGKEEEKFYYRTGDVVRIDENGLLHIRGRIDDQVKIHGMRVELAEVETLLRGIQGIHDVVCVLAEEQLLAYVTMEPDSTLTEQYLVEKARTILPKHMVPAQFRLLPDFPRLPNQKINRKAFKRRGFYTNISSDFDELFNKQLKSFLQREQSKETGKLVEELGKIWQRLLKRSSINLDENFFDIGGDSLSALELLVEIQKQFGAALTIEQLYANSIFKQQLQLLKQKNNDFLKNLQWATLVHTGKSEKNLLWCGNFKPFWRTYLTEYTIFCFKNYYSPAASFTDDPDTIEEMALLYVQDIRKIQPSGPYYLGGFSFAGLVAHEVARLLINEQEDVTVFFLDPAVSVALPYTQDAGPSSQCRKNAPDDGYPTQQNRDTVHDEITGRKAEKSLSMKVQRKFKREYEKIKILPAEINYRLCAKGLLGKMYFGGQVFFAEQKHLEMMQRYTMKPITLPSFLVQTEHCIKKQDWRRFLGKSCKKFRSFSTSHENLGNDEDYVKEWAKEIKEMYNYPCREQNHQKEAGNE